MLINAREWAISFGIQIILVCNTLVCAESTHCQRIDCMCESIDNGVRALITYMYKDPILVHTWFLVY